MGDMEEIEVERLIFFLRSFKEYINVIGIL